MTTLAAGFALAVQPVSAQTITTDTKGLEAGEVKIPVPDGKIPGYRAMPAEAGRSRSPRRAGDLRRPRAHQGHLPPAGQARLLRRRARAVRPPGRRLEDRGLPGDLSKVVSKVPDAQVMSDLDATVAWAKATGKGDTARLAITGFCWGGRIVWLYAAHNPDLKAGVAWYGRLVSQPDPLHPKNPIDLVGALKAPVLGLYGGADQGIPIESVEQMRARP